jgi:hypothetical protein
VPFIGSCIREECHMKTSNSIAFWLLYIPSYLYVHPTKLRRRKMLDCLPNICYPQEDFYSLTFVLPSVFFLYPKKKVSPCTPTHYAKPTHIFTFDLCRPHQLSHMRFLHSILVPNSLVLVHGFSFSISFFPLIVDFTLIGEQVCKLCSFIFF